MAAVLHIAALSPAVLHKDDLWAVVGAKGNVGRPLVAKLKQLSRRVLELNAGADLAALRQCPVVISCTGSPGLITGKHLTLGVTAIDVGFPRGDFDFASCAPKAAFITPVPGGVGPLTVIKLLENTLTACSC